MVKSFAQAFSKACRFLGQCPISLSAESEIFLRSQSQEGRTKLPVDVSSEGNPTKGFPYELVLQVHKIEPSRPRKAAKAAFKKLTYSI